MSGISPKEFAKKFQSKPEDRSEGQLWSSRERRPTLDKLQRLSSDPNYLAEHVAQFFNDNPKGLEGFIKTVRKCSFDIQRQRTEEKARTQKEFTEKQRLENLPQNRIPVLFLGRKAYPENLKKAIETYSLEDFVKVRNSALDKEDTEFMLWLSSIIDIKRSETESLGKKLTNYLHL